MATVATAHFSVIKLVRSVEDRLSKLLSALHPGLFLSRQMRGFRRSSPRYFHHIYREYLRNFSTLCVRSDSRALPRPSTPCRWPHPLDFPSVSAAIAAADADVHMLLAPDPLSHAASTVQVLSAFPPERREPPLQYFRPITPPPLSHCYDCAELGCALLSSPFPLAG